MTMQDDKLVLPVGTKVTPNSTTWAAIIIAICIRDSWYVTYEVSYFNGTEFKTSWMTDKEFIFEESEKITIGFRQ